MSNPEDELNRIDDPQTEVGDGPQADVGDDTSSANLDIIQEEAELNQVEEGTDQSTESDMVSAAGQDQVAEMLKNAQDISGRLEVLVPGVLDTADATNSAADVSRRASSALENGLDHLQKRVNELVEASAKSATLSGRVLLGSVAALLVAIGLFMFMAFQLSDRVAQVDAMMVAVSKRVVKMNTGLNNLETLNYSINQLAIKQGQFASNQKQLVQAVMDAETATKNLYTQVPDAAAKSVGIQTNKLAQQVKNLRSTLTTQGAQIDKVTSSVVALGSQLKSFEGQVDNVSKLNADVEALITLEREKYLDVLRRQVELEKATDSVEQEQKTIDDSVLVYPAVGVR